MNFLEWCNEYQPDSSLEEIRAMLSFVLKAEISYSQVRTWRSRPEATRKDVQEIIDAGFRGVVALFGDRRAVPISRVRQFGVKKRRKYQTGRAPVELDLDFPELEAVADPDGMKCHFQGKHFVPGCMGGANGGIDYCSCT